jgi:hypothetical protein
MTGPEHAREAERLNVPGAIDRDLQRAQTHALLALTAALEAATPARISRPGREDRWMPEKAAQRATGGAL